MEVLGSISFGALYLQVIRIIVLAKQICLVDSIGIFQRQFQDVPLLASSLPPGKTQ